MSRTRAARSSAGTPRRGRAPRPWCAPWRAVFAARATRRRRAGVDADADDGDRSQREHEASQGGVTSLSDRPTCSAVPWPADTASERTGVSSTRASKNASSRLPVAMAIQGVGDRHGTSSTAATTLPFGSTSCMRTSWTRGTCCGAFAATISSTDMPRASGTLWHRESSSWSRRLPDGARSTDRHTAQPETCQSTPRPDAARVTMNQFHFVLLST